MTNAHPNRDRLVVVGTSLLCIGLLWLLGFGFGQETGTAQRLGRPFLGSEVYFGTWWVFLLMIPVCVGIPYATVRFVLRQKLSEFGFSLGDTRQGVIWLLALMPAFLLVPLASAHIGTESYYRYLVEPGFTRPVHLALHGLSYALFAIGFDFLFRGFLLFGLARTVQTATGRWAAIVTSAALSSVLLIGLPWVFPVSALVAGIPVGWLSLRLRSFVYAAVIHWNIGVWSDVWEVVKLHVSGGSIW